MSTHRALSRNEIVGLLTEVGQWLDERGLRGELFVVGGAAMALAYDARRLTADIDAVFEPKSMVYEAIQHVAQRHGLSDGWVNDAVKGFLQGNDANIRVVLEVPGLRVSIPSTEYLLALKIHAARPDRDLDDIRFLAGQLGLTTSSQVLDVAERFFGANRLEPKSQFFIEQISEKSAPTDPQQKSGPATGRTAGRDAGSSTAECPGRRGNRRFLSLPAVSIRSAGLDAKPPLEVPP